MCTFGVLDKNNCHVDISNSEKSTKRYATQHGYDTISARNNSGYYVVIVAKKVNNKWKRI